MLGRLARALVAVLALGCAAEEGSAITPQQFRDAVARQLAEQGITSDSITCAAPREGTAQCEAVVAGAPLAVIVQASRSGATLDARTRDPTLVVAKLEPEVREKLEELGHAVETLACEGVVWRTRKGDTGRCAMTDAQGRRWDYEATFTGTDTHHSAAIVPR